MKYISYLSLLLFVFNSLNAQIEYENVLNQYFEDIYGVTNKDSIKRIVTKNPIYHFEYEKPPHLIYSSINLLESDSCFYVLYLNLPSDYTPSTNLSLSQNNSYTVYLLFKKKKIAKQKFKMLCEKLDLKPQNSLDKYHPYKKKYVAYIEKNIYLSTKYNPFIFYQYFFCINLKKADKKDFKKYPYVIELGYSTKPR
jgi:hypothetical protein